MDSVPELVWRGYGVVDGLRSLVDVAEARWAVCAATYLRRSRNGGVLCLYVTFVPSFVDYNNITLQQFRVFKSYLRRYEVRR